MRRSSETSRGRMRSDASSAVAGQKAELALFQVERKVGYRIPRAGVGLGDVQQTDHDFGFPQCVAASAGPALTAPARIVTRRLDDSSGPRRAHRSR